MHAIVLTAVVNSETLKVSQRMVSRSQHCQEGDNARVLFKETLLGMVGIVGQIKPNLWWPRREEKCSCFLSYLQVIWPL